MQLLYFLQQHKDSSYISLIITSYIKIVALEFVTSAENLFFPDSLEKCGLFLHICGMVVIEDELSSILPIGSRFLDLIYHTFARLPYNFSDHNIVHKSACLVTNLCLLFGAAYYRLVSFI